MADGQVLVLHAVGDRTPLNAPAAGELSDTIDVSRPAGSERTIVRMIVAWIHAAGLALLFPVLILAVGVPLVLAVRGLLAIVQSLFASLP
jgi:hypothetical protein